MKQASEQDYPTSQNFQLFDQSFHVVLWPVANYIGFYLMSYYVNCTFDSILVIFETKNGNGFRTQFSN